MKSIVTFHNGWERFSFTLSRRREAPLALEQLLSPVTENNVCLDVEGNKTDNVFMDLSAG